MHEYPVTQQIIKIAEDHCRRAEGKKVTAVNLVIGDYSGYVGDSVQMYFDIISQGTLCQGARVSIKHIKPKLKCPDCGALFEKPPLSFDCPQCGGQGGPTDIGKEFYIETIEIE
ncbi:MAG TPA: hydrogenase maturation nickel metallochaperone HypA [Candidatus Copromorpha excrementigallinarum]|uniref:Hydrogenase maturation factor HypA n=1 Tax=Candidatus Allocopromorpha excrementigallinarum TaxID=2840742 RepID=A0A9D1I200_9FIRM|nr:hydrogenase maturation nickel metallochaperone HypA [Candidatus Copromorpha excrementigallinarum]